MIIRKEEPKDKKEIYNLVKEAFKNAEHSDGQNITLLISVETQKALFQNYL